MRSNGRRHGSGCCCCCCSENSRAAEPLLGLGNQDDDAAVHQPTNHPVGTVSVVPTAPPPPGDLAKGGRAMTVDDGNSDCCVICLDADKEATLVHPDGTGHRCVCAGCADQLKRAGHPCPLCRKPIQSVLLATFK